MSTKGIILQVSIIIGAIALFIGLMVAPKNYSKAKLTKQKTEQTKSNIQQEVTEVKNEMKKEELAVINGFEAKFESSTGDAKVAWMDSIVAFWDRDMRPAISAVYAKQKAELTGKLDHYMIAGERFMQVGEFLKAEDKPWAYDEAKEIFTKVLEMDPENTDAQIDLGSCWMFAPDPENPMQGITMLKSVVAKDSTNTRAILQLGHFSVLSGQFPKAIERFEQALRIDPKLVQTYLYLGDTYAKMGDIENAEKYLLIYKGFLQDEEEKKQLDSYIQDLKNVEH